MLTLDEAEVLEILVRLPRLIFESEAPKPFPFTWGTKRRRSAIDVAPSPTRLRFRLRLPPFTTPSPLHPATDRASGGGGPTSDTDSLPPVKAEASSPATPLSFSPSESDEKPIVLKKKIPLKRKREDYLNKIEELTKSRELLIREVDNVKRYYDDLKAYNSKLRARKEKLSAGLKMENPGTKISVEIVDASVNSSMAENQDPDQLLHRVHSVPVIVGQMSESSQPTTSFGSTSASSGANTTNMSPLGIPDLNVSPDELIPVEPCQPFDLGMANKHLSRVMAAQARQKRIQLNRVKNSMGINKPRCSTR